MAQRTWSRAVKTRAWQTLIISALASASIWLLTPVLTSHREPWDADGSFYIVALVIAGAVAGTISPRPLWAHYVGSFAGQFGYELFFLHIGPLVVVGAVFLVVYCAVFSIAAALAGWFRGRIFKRSVGSS
jgi:hypothetical protein